MKADTLDALLQVSARAHLISSDSKVFKYALDNSDDDSSDDESEKLEKPSTSNSILDSPPSKVPKDTRRRGRKRRSSKTDNIISKRVDYEFSNINDDENAPKCSSDARQEITYSDEDDIFMETKINTPIDDGSYEF
ncbi:unnamed protein product [Caenorhabditis brenneri]